MGMLKQWSEEGGGRGEVLLEEVKRKLAMGDMLEYLNTKREVGYGRHAGIPQHEA